MKRQILFFSADPGGAECLIPVMQALPEEMKHLLICKGTAVPSFEKYFRSLLKVDNLSFAEIEKELQNHAIDAVVTSASSLPEKDMTEKQLWKWAEKKCIPSIAILDQWDNYNRRFSGIGSKEFMAYLPGKIAIMDKLAKREMGKAGFPEHKLCITGQPALENFNKMVNKIKKRREKNLLRKRIEGFILTFFTQPIKSFFGNEFSYNETTILKNILVSMAILEKELKTNITLVCKLHPKNSMDDFSSLKYKNSKRIVFVQNEYTNHEIIDASDIAIGISSIMLIHSILANVPTISFEPGEKDGPSCFMPAKIRAVSRVTNAHDLAALIKKLMEDSYFLTNYLSRQRRCAAHIGAAKKVIALLKCVINESK